MKTPSIYRDLLVQWMARIVTFVTNSRVKKNLDFYSRTIYKVLLARGLYTILESSIQLYNTQHSYRIIYKGLGDFGWRWNSLKNLRWWHLAEAKKEEQDRIHLQVLWLQTTTSNPRMRIWRKNKWLMSAKLVLMYERHRWWRELSLSRLHSSN